MKLRTKEEKQAIVYRIKEAVKGGSTIAKACKAEGVSYSNYHQWVTAKQTSASPIIVIKKPRSLAASIIEAPISDDKKLGMNRILLS